MAAEFIVSITDRWDGSAYYVVPCSWTTAQRLEREAEAAGLKAVIRRADSAEQALRWLGEVKAG